MITQVELGSGPRAGTAELAAHSEKVPAELVGCRAVSPRPSTRLLARTRGSPKRIWKRIWGQRTIFKKKSGCLNSNQSTPHKLKCWKSFPLHQFLSQLNSSADRVHRVNSGACNAPSFCTAVGLSHLPSRWGDQVGRKTYFSLHFYRTAYPDRVLRKLAIGLPQPVGYRRREGRKVALCSSARAGRR